VLDRRDRLSTGGIGSRLAGSALDRPDGRHLYAVDVTTVRALSSQVHTYNINGPVVSLTTVTE
jgi:hypothetical protein